METRYKAFLIALVVWVFSLVAVYIPASPWVPSNSPLTSSDQTLALFVASTGVASSAALYLGVDAWRAIP